MRKLLAISILMIGFSAMLAAQVSVTSFNSGDPISATAMNTNFSNINIQFTNLDSSHWTYTAGSPNKLGYSGGNFGIGTTNPLYKEHVYNNTTDFVMTVENAHNSGASWGLKIKAGDDAGLQGNQWLLYFERPTGNVGLGGVVQNGTGGLLYVSTSDLRMKKNITETRLSIVDLMNVKVRDYNFKDATDGRKQTGFIAQELYQVYPEAVAKPANESDAWAVDYGEMTPLLVKAIQDQQEEIAALKADNADLQKRLAAIEAKLGM
jgi:hypothetical protein